MQQTVKQAPTVNEVISDVQNDLHAVSLDKYISKKYIHHKLIDAAKLFIKRDEDERRMQVYPSVWVTIDRFEMEESTLIGCTNIPIPKCIRIMKSKLKLPDIYTTRYGYLLNISSVDYNRQYDQITPKNYAYTKTRKYNDPNKRYFWIYNGYLIIPDSFIESVTLRAVFCNKAEGLRLDSCVDPMCIRVLDQEFTAPAHLLDNIKDYVVKNIASIRDRITPSEFPNLNELQPVSPVKK